MATGARAAGLTSQAPWNQTGENLLTVSSVQKPKDFLDHLDVACDLGFHGRCHAERTMNPRKVIVHEIQARGMPKILDFLTEAISQAGHTTHRHSHREILPLGIRSRDVGKLRIPLDTLALHADTF